MEPPASVVNTAGIPLRNWFPERGMWAAGGRVRRLLLLGPLLQ